MSKAEDLAEKLYPKKEHVAFGPLPCEEPSVFDDNKPYRIGFIEGYRQAEKDVIDNLWHDPDEVPEIERKIIFESETFLGKYLGGEWNPKKDVFGKKERWCYLTDILPSKSWNGERPYSRVDYFKGYEQAEKDNELTWEDLKLLQDISREVFAEVAKGSVDYYQIYPTEQSFLKEVLKRFNKRKGEEV